MRQQQQQQQQKQQQQPILLSLPTTVLLSLTSIILLLLIAWTPVPATALLHFASSSQSHNIHPSRLLLSASNNDNHNKDNHHSSTESRMVKVKEAEEELPVDPTTAITLQEQAEKLRAEAEAMRTQLDRQKEEALAKRTAKIDGWIEQLLVAVQVDEATQLLKSEQDVIRRLQEDRFSQEQINAIFNRICELGNESRSNCSPLMELLVDSVGKMDEIGREQNPNKRWSGKVERVLRRRLFAKDWNMDIDDGGEDDDMNPWRLR